MSQGVNEMVVALSAGIPATVLILIILIRGLGARLSGDTPSRLLLSPLRFGWAVHLSSAFLICSCVLAALSVQSSGPSLLRGAIAGLIASVVAFLLLPPLSESRKANIPCERAKAWGISIPLLVVSGALLSVGFFAGSSTNAQASTSASVSKAKRAQGWRHKRVRISPQARMQAIETAARH